MPILPLDHPEPFAATLGIMLYPGLDDSDQRKARAFRSQYLAAALSHHYETGGQQSLELPLQLFLDAGEPLDDLPKRWRNGLAAGNIFKMAFGLGNCRPELATWGTAVTILEKELAHIEESGSRTFLREAQRRYIGVVHLWAAWTLRNGKFTPQPAVGYNGWDDFQSFLCEAEILRRWGQTWLPSGSKRKPLLPEEVWRVPDNWVPPERREGWPSTGMIPHYEVPKRLLEGLKPVGRPRRTN